MFQEFSVTLDGKYCRITNRKARELLAYLLSAKGRAVLKTAAAEALWPDAEHSNALDSLYKVLRYWRNTEPLKTRFPLNAGRKELWLEAGTVECDAYEFDRLYAQKDDIRCLEQAAELYRGAYLYNEYFEWTSEWEAYYEMRYNDVLEILEEHYNALGNTARAYYYRKKKV